MHQSNTHTHTGILFSHKKEWNNIICSNMDGSKDYHIKWSKSDKEGQIYDITYVWSLKHNTNEHKHERETQTHRTDLWCPRVRERDGLGVQGS